jgi:histidinol-phosphatase
VNPDWRARYDAAVEAARQAGRLALGYFDTSLAVEWKGDRSPVTRADREAEVMLRAALIGKFPGDGFCGEESGTSVGTSGYRWIIDPIDGTRSFVRGVPLWATLVGLEYRGEPIAGVVEVPALGQTYRALRGEGAYRGERRLHVSKIASFAEAHLFYSNVTWFKKAGKVDAFLELSARTERQRGFGDFYGFVLVAQGSGELMIDSGVHPWDIAAVVPIIEEAGGRFSNWQGVRTLESPQVIASNGLLHDEALRILGVGRNA